MKKRLFLIVPLGLLALAGCDGSNWQSSLRAQAYPSGNVLELKYGAGQNSGEYASYGGTQFISDLSPLEIVQRGGETEFTAEVILRGGEAAGYLLTVAQEDGTRDFYWLTQTVRKDDEQWYRYTGMRYWMRPEQEGEGSEAFDALIPAFELDAVTSNHTGQDLTLGQSYHCNPVTIGETEYPDAQALFAAFYEATGWYDVTEDGDTLTVREQPDAHPLTDDAHTLQFVFHTINSEPCVTILLAD